jgi:23S rRNA (guanosine2251-2'-O)-methyltransferase
MAKQSYMTIGIHSVKELLKHSSENITRVMFQAERRDKRLQELRLIAKSAQIPTEELGKEDLDKKTKGVHQGVVALYEGESKSQNLAGLLQLLRELDSDPLLLVLDEITDPHNLGACLRSAGAAGVNAVIIPRDRSANLNATVRKVASGAAETVNLVVVTNLARCLQQLKEQGIWLVGADANAEKSLYEQELSGPLALVMGSEGRGLRRLTREKCDFLVSIPMAGVVSSLNVSVATGILLFEAIRQRHIRLN